jgi:ABC-type nitrate/sulfonate/bicarbonate transport system ATPase subunit
MQDELAQLWEQRRKTVVFVTHDAEEALYLADRVVVLSPRPGHVKAEFPISLARPRSLETRFSPQFSTLKRQIWEVIG